MSTARTTFNIRSEQQLAQALLVLKLLVSALEGPNQGRESVGTVTITISDDLADEFEHIEVEVR